MITTTFSATPDDAAAARRQNDMGNGFARQGRFDEAASYYRQAIALDPDCAEAHNNLGNIFREKGQTGEAAACYERAACIRPHFAMAHNNLGIALRELGRAADAEAHHRRALAIEPRYAEAHFNLGNVLSDQSDFDAAAQSYRRAVELQPGYAQAWMNLGNALRLRDRIDEAGECYRRAAALFPNYAEAHHNLGKILLMQDALEDAVICYRRALALKPDLAEAWLDLGNVLARLGRHHDALQNYGRALALDPDQAEAHANRAYVNLLLGDFAAGWAEHEWRWRVKSMAGVQLPPAPLWDGKDLRGKTILLHCEQGLGDSMQFIRYAPLVKEKGGRVFVSCPRALLRLFASMEGIDRLFAEGDDIPAYDCHAPLMSLPLLLGTSLETVPAAVPYLSAPPEQAAAWTERLRVYDGLKVGLVWAGDPRAAHALANAVDRRRSMRLEQFSPLAKIPGVRFFSLQKGGPAAQAKNPPPGMELIDFTASLDDFTDTAAFIANLDLVISVDTSVVHLAGAMGRPVWVLSRFDGCWRWLLQRGDSPWYPTLRLFRQARAGDWPPVIEDVCAALGDFVETPPTGD